MENEVTMRIGKAELFNGQVPLGQIYSIFHDVELTLTVFHAQPAKPLF